MSYQSANAAVAQSVARGSDAVKVAVEASTWPANHASRPRSGRTGTARPSGREAARRYALAVPRFRVGCTRFVSSTSSVPASGSSTIDVPVYPVCPTVTGELIASMYQRWPSCQPSPRAAASPIPAFMSVNTERAVASLTISASPYRPPLRIICPNTARSHAVANTPACPATPPNAHAFSSWTSPCTVPRPVHGWNSVAAVRARSTGLYPVSLRPSGSHTYSATSSSRRWPVTRSRTLPRTMRLRSEYS
ncbi:hypothetical protein SAMN05216298_2846 [Glycomyces sambucus]|uniref:Uncharacterized protein n=1 Tax=Glycomyces sambucus TaxID=380244 RepID=A0A1G9HV63_9ACTN|nr:hypothetical protein [Glycomyces sambucus]SDL16716.1 hypothetical protein SAMN05216298_2846 [Glycomyces sambucus]